MENVKRLIETINRRLKGGALKDAVASKPLSAGGRHVLVLSEVGVAFGAGGGTGEGRDEKNQSMGKGTGGGAGGYAKATPVAVLVVEGTNVRIDTLNR